jgi:hypothetical protein
MRTYDRWILELLAVFVVAACAVIQGQSPPKQRIDPGLESPGGEFVSGTAPANGATLHYVRGGAGPAGALCVLGAIANALRGLFASELPAISCEGKETNMKLTRWMKTTFADARSSSAATQVEVQEPTKRESMRILNGILTLILVGLLIARIASPKAAGAAKPALGPTAESVMAAEEELTRALRNNDADGIARCLSGDWAVISAERRRRRREVDLPRRDKVGFLEAHSI